MKKLFLSFLLLFAVPLAACETFPSEVPAPGTVASRTIVDEQIAIGAHEAYKTFRLAAELGVTAGVIKGGTATKVRELDTQLYGYLQLVDSAYESGNSASLAAAITNFNATLKSANAALGR